MGKEDKRKSFQRLAESRMNKILDTIKLLGNLSRKSNYSYDKRDVDKMKRAIKKELDQTWLLFEKGADTPEHEKFKL